jgi:hypothetical protein
MFLVCKLLIDKEFVLFLVLRRGEWKAETETKERVNSGKSFGTSFLNPAAVTTIKLSKKWPTKSLPKTTGMSCPDT